MAQNDIYIVRQKSDGTFEEIANSPFSYDATNATDMPDKGQNTFHIGTKLRVEELEVNGQTTIIDQDTTTSEQLLVTNDGTGPAAVINQLGTEGIIDIQDDGASALYIRGDAPYGGFVGLGTTTPEKQLELSGDILLQNNQSIFTKDSTGAAIESIKQNANNILSLQNTGAGGIGIYSDNNLAVKIDQSGKVAIGAGESTPEALLELKRVDDANIRFSHKTSSIIAEANVDSANNFFGLSTITDTDLTLGTNSLPFFTLTKEGNVTLEKKTSGSTLTGGDLTIDGTFTSKGDMFSIGDEEILYTKTAQVSGSNVAKSFKFLEFAYNTHDWDSGTAFIIEIFSDYYNAGEYHKYILGHSYVDKAADGSDDGNVDAPGSRDYFLKLTQSYQGHNSSAFRARLSDPESTGLQAGTPPKDIGYVKVYLDLKYYAGARVKVTSLASANSNRISVDAPWSGDDEYKFWNDPQANQEDLVWDDHDPSVEPGDALFASTFYGYSPVNWLGEEKSGAEFEYFLKPADTGASLRVAGSAIFGDVDGGSVGIGLGANAPARKLEIYGDRNAFIRLTNQRTTESVNQILGGLEFASKDTSGDPDNPGAGVRSSIKALSQLHDGTGGNLVFSTATATSNEVEAVRIQSQENVAGVIENSLLLNPDNATRGLKITTSQDTAVGDTTTYDTIGEGYGRHIFKTDGVPRLLINKDGNVGIGTQNPLAALQVNGNILFGDGADNNGDGFRSGTDFCLGVSAAAGGVGVDGFTGLRINSYMDTDNSGVIDTDEEDNKYNQDLEFYTHHYGEATTPLSMIIKNNGKVGIGTENPSTVLDINQPKNNLNGNPLNKDVIMSFSKGETGEARIGLSGGGSQVLLGSVADDLCIRSDGNNIRFGTASATRTDMTINPEGNVGIGAPGRTGARLDVRSLQANEHALLATREDGTRLGTIYRDSNSNGTIGAYNASDVAKVWLNTNGDSYFTGGDVGIGTATPSEILQIGEGVSTQRDLFIKFKGHTNHEQGLVFRGQDDSKRLSIVANLDGSTYSDTISIRNHQDTNVLTVKGSTSDGITNPSTVTIDGNVGIGTGINPSKQLEISGAVNDTPGITLSHTNSAYKHTIRASGTSFALLADDGGNTVGSSTRFFISGTERMRLRKNAEETEARLNINGDVTDPRYALQVSSDSDNDWGVRFQNTYGTNSYFHACHQKYGIRVQNDSADATSYLFSAYNASLPTGTNSSHNNRHALYVRGDGNVGVGTQHPAQRLHITGDVQIDGDLTIAGASVGGGSGGGTGVGSPGDFDMDQMTRLLDTLGLSLPAIEWTTGFGNITVSEGTTVLWQDLRDYLSHQAYRSFSCNKSYLEIVEASNGNIEVRVANGLGTDYDNVALRTLNVTFYVTDLLGRTASKTVNFSVTNNSSDDAPVWNTNNAIYKGESSTHADKGTHNVIALDADRATSYEITGGEDQSALEIASGNMLRFKNGYGPDYEAPDDTGADRTYQVEVTAYNSVKIGSATAASTPRGFTIYIQDAVQDNAPAWVTSSSHSVTEGNVLSVTLDATRADSYSIVGGVDASLFTITSGNNLTFNPTTTGWTAGNIDYDDPKDLNGDNSYEVQVRAINNNGGRYNNRTMIVYVQNNVADDAPVWSQNSVINHMENSTTVVPLTAARASSYTIDASYEDGALFTFRNLPNDTLDFITAPDFENPSSANGDNTYRVRVIAHNNASIGGAQAAGIRDAEKIFTIHVVNDVQDDTAISLTYQSTQALLSDTSQPDGTVAFDAESNSIKIWNSSTQTWASFAPNNTIKIK